MSELGSATHFFWAKTLPDGGPGVSVREHSINVGAVAKIIVEALPTSVRDLLPGEHGSAAALLAAAHDIGKITIGFQAKCPRWLESTLLPPVSRGEIALSVSDHAFVGQAFLQALPSSQFSTLWAVAVGAHHGRPKGRVARLAFEALSSWADQARHQLLRELQEIFGALPTSPPDSRFRPYYSDLWLLAGLITVADWIGSNEVWFSPSGGLTHEQAARQARGALRQIGWPGGGLRQTSFSDAFADAGQVLVPNAIQAAVDAAVRAPGVVVVEGPMGCGKTEAALWAAQRLIAGGHHHGIYFALPTQVTSNRIHRRVEQFLRHSLAAGAPLRLAHGHAWLEEDFDVRLAPATRERATADDAELTDSVHEARSWFSSGRRALLATYGVGTIDQALQAVVAVKHFFVRRFALAGKVVILDEVHSYDVYTGTLVVALIRELIHLRCSVIILSATLTAERRRELLSAAGVSETAAEAAYPLVTSGESGSAPATTIAPAWTERRPIKLRTAEIPEQEVVGELIGRAESGQHVLWIRNTVIEAQLAYRAVMGAARANTLRAGLLHSRYPFHRRATLEEDWLERLGKRRRDDSGGSLLIATQVVEQSVDIDFDFVVSDLAPTDMLLQRVGRLWRHERIERRASEPTMWVRLPTIPDDADASTLKHALGRSARVYAPYVLLRSARVWGERSTLRLPSDIRDLLEATYAVPALPESDGWRALADELDAERRTLAANAEAVTRVLSSPMRDDAEEVLTRRRGAPVTPLLLLRSLTTGTKGSVHAVALDGSRAEIRGSEWHTPSAKFVHQWIVRAPRWMVPTHAPRPRWLALHGPQSATVALVGDDGRCLFDGVGTTLTYNQNLGLYADGTPVDSGRAQDDDDEFDY